MRGKRKGIIMQLTKIAAVFALLVLASEVTVTGSARAQSAPSAQPSFDAEPKPPAPNYADPDAWAARPAKPSHAIDVFYIQPTTFPGPGWNADFRDASVNAITDGGVMKTQATAFSDCCDLYAPRYRQASARAAGSTTGDGAKAYDFAYQDVLRAFTYYLQHDNHGRPFILAGHSQGALLSARLLEEVIDGKPEAKRLVAAYIVGIGLPQGFFGKAYKTVGICRRPDDTGCVVSWNSFVPGSDVTAYLAHSESRYVDRFGDDPSKAILCINPLTFDLDRPAGDAKLHLGAVRDAASIASPVPGLVGAECKNGILFVDAGGAAGVLKPLPNGSLHLQDIELFYGNLRKNAGVRGRAWLSRNQH
jgi:hypothetical protein